VNGCSRIDGISNEDVRSFLFETGSRRKQTNK
jgi:hypothetical protein